MVWTCQDHENRKGNAEYNDKICKRKVTERQTKKRKEQYTKKCQRREEKYLKKAE